MVMLSSMAASLGGPGEYVWYAASKGAIDSMTVGLSKELAADGIRVNAVAPGLIATDIHPPGRLDRLAPMMPIARAGTAEEVAPSDHVPAVRCVVLHDRHDPAGLGWAIEAGLPVRDRVAPQILLLAG